MSNTKNSQMAAFLQALYGAILGVSFYKFAFANTGKVQIYWNPSEFGWYIGTAAAFKLILFIFTLVIVSHDWYSFHKNENIPESQQNNYWRFLPMVFSLLFLSQMFVAADIINLQYWYAFAIGYTLCNVANFLASWSDLQGCERAWGAKYIAHLLLAGSGYNFVHAKYENPNGYWLFWTIIVVALIWIIEHKWRCEKQQPKDLNKEDIEKLTSNIIEAISKKTVDEIKILKGRLESANNTITSQQTAIDELNKKVPKESQNS